MTLFTLTFDLKTVEYIATVLAARPYSEVAAVLGDLQRQVADQQRLGLPMAAGDGAYTANAPPQ